MSIEHNLILMDDATGLPVFNPEARTIKEFRELIAGCRRQGVSYDPAQRKATAKMAGVYFFSSYLSVYHKKEEAQRLKEIVTQVAYLTEEDVKAKDFKNACERFRQLEYVPVIEALEELNAGLTLSLKFVKTIRKTLERLLTDDDKELTAGESDLAMNQINKLVDLASKIPETQTKVDQALIGVRKQTETKKHRRGGKKVYPREVP